jgi:hypothetical protein
MTEEEWLKCSVPDLMLELLRDKTSDRKLWLFTCACHRGNHQLMSRQHGKETIETIEAWADGCASDIEMWSNVIGFCETESSTDPDEHVFLRAIYDLPAWYGAHMAILSMGGGNNSISAEEKWQTCADYLRCLFGNPFQWVTPIDPPGRPTDPPKRPNRLIKTATTLATGLLRIMGGSPQCHYEQKPKPNEKRTYITAIADPGWLTSTVVALAQGIYTDRAFDRMPILADALQDAGCENAAILDHCRDPKGVHVRGCFVVDMILDKA